MQARTAGELEDLFEDAYAARDAAALIGLFEDDAVVVAPDGVELRGEGAVAGLAEEFWKDDLAYVSKVTRVVEAGDVGVIVAQWSLSGTDGHLVDQGIGVDVVRRQPDGTWKYLIGLPGGTG